MPSSKKKLPTGPIRIDTPVTKRFPDSLDDEASKPQPLPEKERVDQIPESRKQDSGLQESANSETVILDSISEETRLPETALEESALKESRSTGMSSPETRIPESGISESEYKKVAMRLSAEAVESLRQLRATTGIPYEILVDVMIRNWDSLPQRTRTAYLQQAKQARMQRLIAGQEKTMKTMQQKYSNP